MPGAGRFFGTANGGPMRERWRTVYAWNPDDATPDALAFAPSLLVYPGLGGAPPYLKAEDDGVARVLTLHDHHAREVDAAWIVEATEGWTDLTVGPDVAWWQTWGDGRPLQVRDLATGVVIDQPGDDDLAIRPPRTLVDGVPWTIGTPEEPAPTRVLALHPDGVTALPAAPRGLYGVRALPDGRVVGWALSMTDETFYMSLVVEEGGEWRYSPGSCEPEVYFESLEVVDGALYAAGGRVGLERMTVAE